MLTRGGAAASRPLLQPVRALAPPMRRLALLPRPQHGAVNAWPRHARHLSAEPAEASSSDDAGPPMSPKVAALVDEIASLSLLEAAELTEGLKVNFAEILPALSRAFAAMLSGLFHLRARASRLHAAVC